MMVSYNLSMVDKEKNGENTILRLTAGYTLKKVHVFSFSYVMAFRRSSTVQNRDETTVTLTYRYSFGWTPFNNKEKNKKSSNETAPKP